MTGLIHDSTFGQIFRLISGGRFPSYADEKDASLLEKYLGLDNSVTQNLELNTVENGIDRYEVTWYGATDPENPQNWSSGKKLFVTTEICFLNFAVYVGSAIYTASEKDIMEKFHVSEVVATLGLVLFVFGYGFGPMLWSPMSEIPRIGRSPTYVWTLVIFVVLQVPTALSTNITGLLILRFIAGFVGSPILATGGATIADMYKPSKRAYGICIWGALGFWGPSFGPVVGGFAVPAKGWEWTIWELMWVSGFALIVIFFFLPETSSANILHRRAQRLRRLTGNSKLSSKSEIIAHDTSLGRSILFIVRQAFSISFREPIVLAVNLYTALVYGLLYMWFESFESVFIGIYGFNMGEEGLAFLGILIGAVIALPFFLWHYHVYLEPRIEKDGNLKPEARLPPACVGAFCFPICLFWFGWTARASVHWIVPIIGSGVFAVGLVLLFNSALNYLVDAYPAYAASVFAGNSLFRASCGAAFPLFARTMYKRLGTGGASSLLGGLSILFIPIPFALYFAGERIRNASRRARHDI